MACRDEAVASVVSLAATSKNGAANAETEHDFGNAAAGIFHEHVRRQTLPVCAAVHLTDVCAGEKRRWR